MTDISYQKTSSSPASNDSAASTSVAGINSVAARLHGLVVLSLSKPSRICSFLGALLLALLVAFTPQSNLCLAANPVDYDLKTGDLIVTPDQSSFLLPVYLTSPSPTTEWRFNLAYDTSLVRLVDYTFADTLSENLGASGRLGPLNVPPYFSFLASYSSANPLTPGSDLLVAYLEFEVIASSTHSNTGVTSVEGMINNNPTPPNSSLIDIFTGSLISLGNASASPVEHTDHTSHAEHYWDPTQSPLLPSHGAILLPLSAWTNGDSIGALQIGLDYDDYFMCGIDLEDGILGGTDYDVDISYPGGGSTGHTNIQITLASPISPLEGELLGYIRLLSSTPVQAVKSITFDNLECSYTSNGSTIYFDSTRGAIAEYRNEFIRGDVNVDGRLRNDDLATLIHILLGTPAVCLEAGDIDNDGSVGPLDLVKLFDYLYNSGAQPASPFPVAGPHDENGAFDCLATIP